MATDPPSGLLRGQVPWGQRYKGQLGQSTSSTCMAVTKSHLCLLLSPKKRQGHPSPSGESSCLMLQGDRCCSSAFSRLALPHSCLSPPALPSEDRLEPIPSEKEAQRVPGSSEEAFRTDFDGRKQKMNQVERVTVNFGSTRPCFALTYLVWCHCPVSCETCVLTAHLASPFPSPASVSTLASQGTMLGVLKGPACSNTTSIICWGGDMMGFVKNIQLVTPTLPGWLIGIRDWKP